MKIIDRFILKAYMGPLVRSFGVILFILVLQFISMYKDDLFGKGLEFIVMLRIFLFASASLVILALPASVLLASLFTLGNMGEHYEMAAFRSSGVRLARMLRPMIISTFLLSAFSFVFAVYIVPEANLKLYTLIYDVKQVKPTFALVPGEYYNDIQGYSIRIHSKNLEREMLYGIEIYDHTQGERPRVVKADSGSMFIYPEGVAMKMTLYNGLSKEEMFFDAPSSGKNTGLKPYAKKAEDTLRVALYYFDTLIFRFDLSAFVMTKSDEKEFEDHWYMLNIVELHGAIDSLRTASSTEQENLRTTMRRINRIDSSFAARPPDDNCGNSMIGWFPEKDHFSVYNMALQNARTIRAASKAAVAELQKKGTLLRNYEIEYHGKFSLPLACVIFLLIGAPLGSIIRKGGIGIPIIFSILFYVTFYVLLIQGKKMARTGVLEPWMGVWMPLAIFFPVALFVTYEATHDTRILNARLWWVLGQRLSAVLWYINPVRLLLGLQIFRRALIWLLETIINLNPRKYLRYRRMRRRGMRITRGDKEEFIERQ